MTLRTPRLNIFIRRLASIVWLVVLSVGATVAETDATETDVCVVENASHSVIDSSIQDQLKERYSNNQCFTELSGSENAPLSDGVVGIVTKQWIERALLESAETCNSDHANCNETQQVDRYDIGIQPVVLESADIAKLVLNGDVLALLTALTEDTEANSFVTRTEGRAAILETIAGLEGMTDALLDEYVALYSKYLSPVSQKVISENMLEGLLAEGKVEVADALTGLVGQAINESDIEPLLVNVLTKAIVVPLEAKQEEVKAVLSGDVELEEEVSDEAFIAKVAAIVEAGDDPKTLIEKLTELGKKLNPFGKDFKVLRAERKVRIAAAEAALEKLATLKSLEQQAEEDGDTSKIEDWLANETEDSYTLARRILVREIREHETKAIEFDKKKKSDEADDEHFIANELKVLYAEDNARVAENTRIRQKNTWVLKVQTLSDTAKLAEVKEELAAQETEISNATDAVQESAVSIAGNLVAQRRFALELPVNMAQSFTTIDASLAACLAHWEGVYFPSQASFKASLEGMLASLDTAAFNLANPDAPKYNGNFNCDVESLSAAGEGIESNRYANSVIADVLTQRVMTHYETTSIDVLELTALPGCTRCVEPLNGTSYGFFPYWSSPEKQSDTKLLAGLDFSMFTNIAYFAVAVEDNGEMGTGRHLDNTQYMKSFFETLKTYNVKRDVVVYFKNWQHWEMLSQQDDTAKTLNETIAGYAKDHLEQLNQWHSQFSEWGGISGVTFYFDDYSNQSDASNLSTYLESFHSQMTQQINAGISTDFELNLMLGIVGLENSTVEVGDKWVVGDSSYFKDKIDHLFMNERAVTEGKAEDSDFKAYVGGEKDDADYKVSNQNPVISNVLMVLNESTSPYKKKLRMQIEYEFAGGNRVDAFLAMVPILNRVEMLENSEERTLTQFQDDIAYLKYNFGGMGLWNLPITWVEAGATEVTENPAMSYYRFLLSLDYGDPAKNFIHNSQVGVIGQVLLSEWLKPYIDVCGEVCPKRDFYVWVLGLLLFANVVVEWLWRNHCRSRKLIKSARPTRELLLILTLVVFFALLGCHPTLQRLSTEVLGLFVGFVVLASGYRYLTNGYEKDEQ